MTNDDVLRELAEHTKWIRLLGIQALRPVLEVSLTSENQRRVFELSDGRRTTRQIAAISKVGASTVSRYWSEWAKTGIVAESQLYRNRMQHIASLSDMGLDVPDVPKSERDPADDHDHR